MKRVWLWFVIVSTLATWPRGTGAHTPITIEVIEPSGGEVVLTNVVRVSLRATASDPSITSTLVHLMIDDLWYHPVSGELVRSRPAFAGITIRADQTKQVRIEDVPAGEHVLKVSYSPHAGEAPVVTSVPFEVSSDAAAAKRRGSTYFLFAVAVLGAAALWLQLSWRRRMSRS